MTTTSLSAALVPVTPVFTNAERLALAGFLAGYSGLTRQAYELDLRQYAAWCVARRPADHHALRPGPHQPGPARHLHRLRLPRRGSPLSSRYFAPAWPNRPGGRRH
ncbi:MAG: hypothetical protein ACRDRJ_13370 [Streptosporangiaceae bacterium]